MLPRAACVLAHKALTDDLSVIQVVENVAGHREVSECSGGLVTKVCTAPAGAMVMYQPRAANKSTVYVNLHLHKRNPQTTLLASGMEASAAVPMDATNHADTTAGNGAADGVPGTSAGICAQPLEHAPPGTQAAIKARFVSSTSDITAMIAVLSAVTADPDNPLVKKFNELTAAVGTKPDDFSSWTNLLSTVEKLVRHVMLVCIVSRSAGGQ
eukprot:GHUV01021239.1.p1 GENE.GHUV01021239.1~~GHUV01021239.1.p1  ORF type:complete len:212 (-),score=16.78 GHUV01021239.1:15-650(-)